MAKKVFVDTDVIIDFLIDRQPHANSATLLFDLAEKNMLQVCTSSVVINNVHYIIKRTIGDKKARSIIKELLEIVDILSVSRKHIKHAISSDFKDFEDAIQYAVALKGKGIKSIVTRNIKDYSRSKISVFHPDAYLKILKNEG